MSVSGIAISGTDAANYTLASTTDSTTANITVRTLTVTATGINKIADGTTAATVTLSDDRIAGDVLTTSYSAANFVNSSAGTGKTVNVTGIAMSGTDASNYTLASTTDTTTATINPAVAATFTLTGGATQTAGVANALTINAYDAYGNLVSFGPNNYTGDQTLTFSGANDSPLGDSPTVTDKSGTPIDFGTGTTITFSNGAATVGGSMVLYKAESANIAVTDGTVTTPTALAVTVSPNVKNKLLWSPEPGTTQTEDAVWSSFSVEITDTYGNRTADTDSITIAPSAGAFGGTTSQPAVGGIATFNDITYPDGATITVTGTSGALTATSPAGPITVSSGTPDPTPDPTPTPPVDETDILPGKDGPPKFLDDLDKMDKEQEGPITILVIIEFEGEEEEIDVIQIIATAYGFDEMVRARGAKIDLNNRFRKWYRPGRYRTTVTMFDETGDEVNVNFYEYNDKGLGKSKGIVLKKGQKVYKEGVIKKTIRINAPGEDTVRGSGMQNQIGQWKDNLKDFFSRGTN